MYVRGRDEEALKGPGKLDAFDPNAKPLPRPRHASYAPFRSPEWKIHSNVGHVKNAMKQHRFIARYEWVDAKSDGHKVTPGHWVEIERRAGEERKEWARKAIR